jgi:uncharacterized repeat protein (TIGR03803 family)
MQTKKPPIGLLIALSIIATTLALTPKAFPQETILYNFIGGKLDGIDPEGPLIFDAAGNLYGSTSFGDKYNHGSVFKLTPTESGSWN